MYCCTLKNLEELGEIKWDEGENLVYGWVVCGRCIVALSEDLSPLIWKAWSVCSALPYTMTHMSENLHQ